MTQLNQRIVVLGSGYAGLMAAMRLARKTDANQVAITLINAADTFNERVRNHQLAAGQPLQERLLSALLLGTRIQFLQGNATAFNPAQRQITLQTDTGIRQIGYDYLVYALGSYVDVGQVPGARQYAYTLDAESARLLARRLPDVAARNGRLLLIGGGNTGVEVVTELAEAYPGLQITLVTRRSFARNLSAGARTHIRKAFTRFGITFMEDTSIVELQAECAITENGKRLPFDVCIWAGGFAVSNLAQQAGLRVNSRHQILIDRAMRSLSHPEIYAVGDAACPLEEPGAPIRMSLYTAIMMGAHGADCLAAQLNGRTPTAFGLSYIALGLSLGRRDGLFQFLNRDTDAPLNLIVTGRPGNWLREFFVKFALWSIKIQRIAPWVFAWPGRNKLRQVVVAGHFQIREFEPSMSSEPVAPLKR